MKIIGVIPARYESTRFPGKPLADIGGYPMIYWVFKQCKKVSDFDAVYVATDSEIIYNKCVELGVDVVMTSTEHKTGTDRIGEVAERIDADLIVNIQGDEPLIEPETIRAAILPFYDNPDLKITNLMTRIDDPVDVVNPTIVKVITNSNNFGIFLSRTPIPHPKGNIKFAFFKQLGIYGFKPEALKFYCQFGKKYGKAKIESIEDIEILRFIENNYRVYYSEVTTHSIAVDTPNDLVKVNKYISENGVVL